MMTELLVATALALLALAWWMRRTALRPAPVRVRTSAPAPEPACAPTATLMAASTDVAGATTSSSGGTGAAPQGKPPRKKPSGPTRRQFLKTGMTLGALGWLTAFGAASLAFIWPNLRGGFGARIPVDTEAGVLSEIDANAGRFEFPEARALIVRYDASLDPGGQYAEITNGASVMALYQRCVHLGCKVPWCADSQWWECPCHGSKYNRWGEWQEGPAARGLDRFAVEVVDGQVVVDTSTVITGPARTAAVLNQPPEGPHCVDV